MILALVVALAAAVLGLLRGGSLDPLAETKLHWLPLLFGALLFQAGFDIWDPAWLTDPGDLGVLLLSHAAVAVFFASNWKLPGMWLAAVGFALNVAVIGVNGAMPVSDRAAELAGLEDVGDLGIKHERLDDNTAVPWLADVIPVPGTGKIVSLGDILLAGGIGWLVYRRTMTTPVVEKSRPTTTTNATSD